MNSINQKMISSLDKTQVVLFQNLETSLIETDLEFLKVLYKRMINKAQDN